MKRKFSQMSKNDYRYNKVRRLNNNNKQVVQHNIKIQEVLNDISSMKNDINNIYNEMKDIKEQISQLQYFVGFKLKKFENPPSYIC